MPTTTPPYDHLLFNDRRVIQTANILQVNGINHVIFDSSRAQNIRFHNMDTWVILFLAKLTCDRNIHARKII